MRQSNRETEPARERNIDRERSRYTERDWQADTHPQRKRNMQTQTRQTSRQIHTQKERRLET